MRSETGPKPRGVSPETLELLRRKGLLSPEDLAEFLHLPVSTIYRWRSTRSGPPGFRIGKHVRFSPEDVARWLESQMDPVP